MKNRLKRGLGILLSIILISQCGGYVQATDVQQPTEQMTPEQQKEAEIQASYNKAVESNAIRKLAARTTGLRRFRYCYGYENRGDFVCKRN